MKASGVLRALGPIDVKSVRRDSLLRWMLALPVALALLVRWGLPAIAAWADLRFGADLASHDPLILSVLVLTTPIVFGSVIGFLLLDEKDERTLTALQVTPLTPGGYLAYRLGVPAVLSVGMTVVALALTGRAGIGVGRQLVAAVAATPLAAFYALLLGAFARNKVQGFALSKAAGVLSWPPVIAWFVDSDWQYLFGVCPTYWPAKAYWELEAGGGWAAGLPCVVSLAYLSLLALALLRRFDRAVHR